MCMHKYIASVSQCFLYLSSVPQDLSSILGLTFSLAPFFLAQFKREQNKKCIIVCELVALWDWFGQMSKYLVLNRHCTSLWNFLTNYFCQRSIRCSVAKVWLFGGHFMQMSKKLIVKRTWKWTWLIMFQFKLALWEQYLCKMNKSCPYTIIFIIFASHIHS